MWLLSKRCGKPVLLNSLRKVELFLPAHSPNYQDEDQGKMSVGDLPCLGMYSTSSVQVNRLWSLIQSFCKVM